MPTYRQECHFCGNRSNSGDYPFCDRCQSELAIWNSIEQITFGSEDDDLVPLPEDWDSQLQSMIERPSKHLAKWDDNLANFKDVLKKTFREDSYDINEYGQAEIDVGNQHISLGLTQEGVINTSFSKHRNWEEEESRKHTKADWDYSAKNFTPGSGDFARAFKKLMQNVADADLGVSYIATTSDDPKVRNRSEIYERILSKIGFEKEHSHVSQSGTEHALWRVPEAFPVEDVAEEMSKEEVASLRSLLRTDAPEGLAGGIANAPEGGSLSQVLGGSDPQEELRRLLAEENDDDSVHMASGGKVENDPMKIASPGSKDSIPAMLEPGEGVLTKDEVTQLGKPTGIQPPAQITQLTSPLNVQYGPFEKATGNTSLAGAAGSMTPSGGIASAPSIGHLLPGEVDEQGNIIQGRAWDDDWSLNPESGRPLPAAAQSNPGAVGSEALRNRGDISSAGSGRISSSPDLQMMTRILADAGIAASTRKIGEIVGLPHELMNLGGRHHRHHGGLSSLLGGGGGGLDELLGMGPSGGGAGGDSQSLIDAIEKLTEAVNKLNDKLDSQGETPGVQPDGTFIPSFTSGGGVPSTPSGSPRQRADNSMTESMIQLATAAVVRAAGL